MEWDKSLETGIPVVDEQHQSLIRQVNELLDSSNTERISETLVFLGEYTLMHFGTEEMMQKASKYPRAAEHKQMHDEFIVALVGLQKECDANGIDMLALMKVTKFAVDWLYQHIMKEDKDFGDYFKASGFAESKEGR